MHPATPLLLLTTLLTHHTLAIPQQHHQFGTPKPVSNLPPKYCTSCDGGNLAITVPNGTDPSDGRNWCARGHAGGKPLNGGTQGNVYAWDLCLGSGKNLVTGVVPDPSGHDCTLHLEIEAPQRNQDGTYYPLSVLATVEASLASIGTVGPYETAPVGGGETVGFEGLDYGILIFATGWTTSDPWIFQTNGTNSTEMYTVDDSETGMFTNYFAHLEAKFDCVTGVFAEQAL